MTEELDLWRMLAGIGLFLFAIAQLEAALKSLGGRALSRTLRRGTDRPWKAVGVGVIATVLLRSSSVVGLMVLAFVGAGLLTLPGALGVVFGANLGTTFTGWIVAALGFRFDIEDLILPLLAVGSLLFLAGRDRLASIGQATVGLGLLLLGLEFMKVSVATLPAAIDIATLAGFAPWQYLLFGCAFAAVVQSSSATMMITLAALDAQFISLPNAAAIAIGADLGTTSTVLLGAVKGAGVKRQVASAHLVFNLVTDIIAFVLRLPLLGLVAMAGIDDPLYALVAFHSLFNLIGLALFVPLITPLAAWLQRLHRAPSSPAEAHYMLSVNPDISDAALQAVDRETAHLIARVVRQNMLVFSPALPMPPGRLPVAVARDEDAEVQRFNAMYDGTKRLEGEILRFAVQVQAQPLEAAASARLNQLLAAVREAVHSAKQLKDIRHNLQALEDAPGVRVNAYLDHYRSVMSSFTAGLFALRRQGDSAVSFEDLVELIQQVHEWHDRLHREIYTDMSGGTIPEAEVSSLLNVNREVLNSNLSLLAALAEYHLEPGQAQAMRRLPGVG